MNLEQFYKENYRIVFGYLYSLCGDLHMAEDLTSETFLKAIIKIGSYDGRVKASTWLCTIGRNLYLNEVKKRSRHVPLEGIPVMEGDSMEDTYVKREQAELVRKLILELEEPKNRVVIMRQQGLSFRDIGDALGKSENWARVTFYRAKEKILERLEGME